VSIKKHTTREKRFSFSSTGRAKRSVLGVAFWDTKRQVGRWRSFFAPCRKKTRNTFFELQIQEEKKEMSESKFSHLFLSWQKKKSN
jgi:hypothetical protein